MKDYKPFRTGRVTLYQLKSGVWSYHIAANNGKILASGEEYNNRSSAIRAVTALRRALVAPEVK